MIGDNSFTAYTRASKGQQGLLRQMLPSLTPCKQMWRSGALILCKLEEDLDCLVIVLGLCAHMRMFVVKCTGRAQDCIGEIYSP